MLCLIKYCWMQPLIYHIYSTVLWYFETYKLLMYIQFACIIINMQIGYDPFLLWMQFSGYYIYIKWVINEAKTVRTRSAEYRFSPLILLPYNFPHVSPCNATSTSLFVSAITSNYQSSFVKKLFLSIVVRCFFYYLDIRLLRGQVAINPDDWSSTLGISYEL